MLSDCTDAQLLSIAQHHVDRLNIAARAAERQGQYGSGAFMQACFHREQLEGIRTFARCQRPGLADQLDQIAAKALILLAA